jgi:hypothetical protein
MGHEGNAEAAAAALELARRRRDFESRPSVDRVLSALKDLMRSIDQALPGINEQLGPSYQLRHDPASGLVLLGDGGRETATLTLGLRHPNELLVKTSLGPAADETIRLTPADRDVGTDALVWEVGDEWLEAEDVADHVLTRFLEACTADIERA